MEKFRLQKIILFPALMLLISQTVRAQQTTIQFWNVGRSDDAIMYRRLAQRFEQQTGIRVVVTPLGWGNFQQKYMTAMAARMPPDIGATNLGGPYEYGRVGGVIDLAAEFPDDFKVLREQLFDNLWPAMIHEGRVFGVPNGITTLFLYYRKDIFAQLQLEPPRTWNELEKTIRTLNRHDYQYGFEWTREDGWASDMWLYPFGTLRVSADKQTVPWDRPAAIRGFQVAVRFWNLFNMPAGKNSKPVELFSAAAGDYGLLMPMFIDYSLRYTEIEAKSPHLKGKWGIAPLPTADNGKARLPFGGTALVIFRLSQKKQAAMKWLRFIMSPEIQFEILQDFMFGRSERNELFMSPNRRMYTDFPQPYDPATKNTIVTAISQIGSNSPTPGMVQVDRLLDNLFKSIRTAITGELQRLARRHELSLWDYKKALAAGRFPQEWQRLRAFADSATAANLRTAKPEADAELRRSREEYEKYYQHLLEELPHKENAPDVLDRAKLAVALLIAAAVIFLLLNPATRPAWRSYLFISPPILLLLVFMLIPIIVSVYLSFTKYNPILPLSMSNWIGAGNYWDLLKGRVLWQSLGRSLYFAALTIPIQLFTGIILAVGLDKGLKPDRLYKFAFFSPLVTSIVSVSLIWTALYIGTKYGWLNALLLKTGLTRDPILFLDNQATFLNSVIIMTIWHGLAFVILINLAGLQSIPKTLYEAATIDGAGPVQTFFRITLPALRPQIVFLTITGTIGTMQVFEQIFMLGGGSGESGTKFGPNDSGMTMVPFIFRKGFEDFRMGEASAVAYILFFILFALSLLNWKILAREE